MWIIRNTITGYFFAGWHQHMPVTTPNLQEAHHYAHWGDAAQVCTVLIGHWEPYQLKP